MELVGTVRWSPGVRSRMLNEDENARPFGLPSHGSRRRYRSVGCRCVACTRGPKGNNLPAELRWPYRWLEKKFGADIKAWFSADEIQTWKNEGLGDFEADEVCVTMGVMPFDVFPGYLEAGLDSGIYP